MTDFRKWGVAALLMLALALGAFAQARIDYTGATVTKPFTSRPYFPGTCEPFQFMVYEQGTPGDNLYICSSTGKTWVKVSGTGGGAASLASTTNLLAGDGLGGSVDSGVSASAINSKQPSINGGPCPAGQHVSNVSSVTGAITCSADTGSGGGTPGGSNGDVQCNVGGSFGACSTLNLSGNVAVGVGSGTPGCFTFGDSGPTNAFKICAPTSLAGSVEYDWPTSVTPANDVIVWGAPSGGITQGTFTKLRNQTVQVGGASQTQRGKINLIAGSNVTITPADNAGSDSTDVTISSTGGAGGGLPDTVSNGIVARTATNTTTARVITGTTGQITVTNGDGVAGNPTLALPNTTVSAGSYQNADITFDAQGRATAAANGSNRTVQVGGSSQTRRGKINLIAGTNVTITPADNSGADSTDVTIAATAGAGGYATVQDEGSGLTPRSTINFTGSGVNCVDNAGSARTDCTINGGGGSTTYVERWMPMMSQVNAGSTLPGAGWFMPSSGGPTGTLFGTTPYFQGYYAFGHAATNTANFEMQIPSTWNSSTNISITGHLIQGSGGAVGNTVNLGIQAQCIPDGTVFNSTAPTWGTGLSFNWTLTTTTASTFVKKTITLVPGTNITCNPGDHLIGQLQRIPTAAGSYFGADETMTGNVGVFGLTFKFTNQ